MTDASEWRFERLCGPTDAAAPPIDGSLTVLKTNSTHLNVFWVGADKWVYCASGDGGQWRDPSRVTQASGASPNAGLAVVSRFAGHREVWWVDAVDGSVQGAYRYDGFTEWKRYSVPGSSGASTTAGLAAVSRSADHMEVWWVHQSGAVQHSWYHDANPDRWIEQPQSIPKAVGAATDGRIAALSRDADHMEVWWVHGNGSIHHSWWTGESSWPSQPAQLAGAAGVSTASGVTALSRSADHMEVWWLDKQGNAVHTWWTRDESWSPSSHLIPDATGGSTRSMITACGSDDTRMDIWWADADGSLRGSWWTRDTSWVPRPAVVPKAEVAIAADLASLAFDRRILLSWIGPDGSVHVAVRARAPESSQSPAPVLENAARQVLKATHVLVEKPTTAADTADVLQKVSAVRQLSISDEELDYLRREAGHPSRGPNTGTAISRSALAVLEDLREDVNLINPTFVAVLAETSSTDLAKVADAVATLRSERMRTSKFDPLIADMQKGMLAAALNAAAIASRELKQSPIGMLNLERLEMVPAGIQRGELVATIPLAPGEETAVVFKEWSHTSREFTTIVTDEMEQFSEMGVTDNTDLAQSTTSQSQHSNQFNITGTVQGGVPVISGSTTTGFTGQDSGSRSATESIKQSRTLTEKASSRSRREHKVTITARTDTGTEQTSTRIIRNPEKVPIRIDYFSMMREWRVRLYRYGLRLTYDVVVPEPGAGLRKAYARLASLRKKQGAFAFAWTHSDITNELGKVNSSGAWESAQDGQVPKYLWIAEQFGASPRPYPTPDPVKPEGITGTGPEDGWYWQSIEFDVPQGNIVDGVRVSCKIGRHDETIHFAVLGTDFYKTSAGPELKETDVLLTVPGGSYLHGQVGRQKVFLFMHYANRYWVQLSVTTKIGADEIDSWKKETYSLIRDAAYQRYIEEQQDIAAEIAELEERLISIDTLTLRRQENDEIMKNVLRWLLPQFGFMPDTVLVALKNLLGLSNLTDEQFEAVLTPGTVFDDFKLSTSNAAQWDTFSGHRDKIRFINQAIEWENVVTFLYSYFWDIPVSWPAIRELRHPDPTRQAFLQSGAARVVLTVRKGWEKRWMAFAKTLTVPEQEPADVEFPIAKEIAAYDDRNYPGVPPANPARSAIRLQDSVYTTCRESVAVGDTTLTVESSRGFVAGLDVVIDSPDKQRQEAVLVKAIPSDTLLVVAPMEKAHDGEKEPFAVLQPGEKGALIAEWREYTPSSGTDIAVTSDLSTIA